MNMKEEFVANLERHEGKVFTAIVDQVRCPNGRLARREVARHHGGVCVAPITDKGELIILRQFRYAYDKVLWELPAGKLEAGEDPLESGKRELREETGALAKNFFSLGEFYPTCGYCDEVIHLYGATGLSFTEQDLDEDEVVELHTLPLDQVVDMIVDGTIKDGKTVAAVLKLNELKRRGKLDGNL